MQINMKDYLGNKINIGDIVIVAKDKYFDKAKVLNIRIDNSSHSYYAEQVQILSEASTKPGWTYPGRLIVIKNGNI